MKGYSFCFRLSFLRMFLYQENRGSFRHRLYEEMRRQKEAKKNQKAVVIKEIRMSVRVEEHDIQVKVKNAIKFLTQGNRVKITIRFRGREMAYTEQGKTVLLDFANRLKDYGNIDKNPKLEGRSMSVFMSPKKEYLKKDNSKKQQNKQMQEKAAKDQEENHA